MVSNMKTLPIVEIFKSIQGEGRYQGHPVTFVRTSGCTRECHFCDTRYHTKSTSWSLSKVIKKIESLGSSIVVWTGGEPLLFIDEIAEIKKHFKDTKSFHVETNGDLAVYKRLEFHCLSPKDPIREYLLQTIFDYICISPKELKTAKKIGDTRTFPGRYDIKVVTDFETYGMDMVPYATMLMPLTTHDSKKDLEIRQRVWTHCSDHDLLYSGRLHVEVWGTKRKV